MVGLVVVSHSARLAAAAIELAREMAGDDVQIVEAGGLGEAGVLGTDATRVLAAIEKADSGDGILILVDLGSALLSAETARSLAGARDDIRISAAPFVEGLVTAAVEARLGSTLDRVATEAEASLHPKQAQLGPIANRDTATMPAGGAPDSKDPEKRTITVHNAEGLHARPAARFVETVGRFDAQVSVRNLTLGSRVVDGRSINGLATIGAAGGHEIEIVAGGPQAGAVLEALADLAGRDFGDSSPSSRPVPATVGGPIGASAGIAIGPAWVLERVHPPIPDGQVSDPSSEIARLDAALGAVDQRLESERRAAPPEGAGIFAAHRLTLEDAALLEPARAAIRDRQISAARAWMDAVQGMVAQYGEVEDPIIRSRADDLLSVGWRVVDQLVDPTGRDVSSQAAGIVVASDLTPAETAGFDPTLVLGIITAAGAPTSHAAILARSKGIPAVVGAGSAIAHVASGTLVALDGSAGAIWIDPEPGVVNRLQAEASRIAELREVHARAALQPARTEDGVRILVAANAGSLADVTAAGAAGADGVGLLRTEFMFLDRPQAPTVEEHVDLYTAMAQQLDGRRLIVRTLDVGGDKPLPYVNLPKEANPFLGVRGFRILGRFPELIEVQLEALARVGREYPIGVMFPMIATPEEARRAVDLAAEATRRGAREDADVEIGVMIEVPAAALRAHEIARHVDFMSIGTNDLTQYTMAAERGNPDLASIGDPLDPAVLTLVRMVAEAGKSNGSRVAVCGEVAADPNAVPLLVGLGVGELSVAVPSVGAVKATVRDWSMPAAERLAARALAAGSGSAVRGLLDLGTPEPT